MESHCEPGRCLFAAGMLIFAATASAAAEDWQLNRLMAPSPAQLAAEAGGAVVIYDGLEAGQVAAAMDEHFERIENMMFTRIHHLPPAAAGGPAHVEQDGCD